MSPRTAQGYGRLRAVTTAGRRHLRCRRRVSRRCRRHRPKCQHRAFRRCRRSAGRNGVHRGLGSGHVPQVVGNAVTTLARARAQFGATDGEPWVARFTFPSGIAAATGRHDVRRRPRQDSRGYGRGPREHVDGLFRIWVPSMARRRRRASAAVTASLLLRTALCTWPTPATIPCGRLHRDGSVTTLAGLAGVPGYADGAGSAARFEFLAGIAVDPFGNVYVSEHNRRIVRKITPAGVVTTFAGLPVFGRLLRRRHRLECAVLAASRTRSR